MKNVLFGKLGQTIVFDRNHPDAIRSNTNGNYEAYNMLQLLLDHMQTNVFVVEDNIITTLEQQRQYLNLRLITDAEPIIDCAFILLGVDKTKVSPMLLKIINSGIKWYALATDPRCLTALTDIIENPPEEVFAGANDITCVIGGKRFDTKYLNLESASVLGELPSRNIKSKHNDLVVIANETNTWDRIADVKAMTGCICPQFVHIYGRCKDEDKDERFRGEKTIQFIYNAQLLSKVTYVAPISRGWITAKYIESITRGVIPLFSYDYAYTVSSFIQDIEDVDPNLIVSTPQELSRMYENIVSNDSYYKKTIRALQKMVTEKYSPELLRKRLLKLINKE